MKTLTNPSDRELDAEFSEYAGWRCFKKTRGEYTLCISLKPGDKEPWEHWNEKERDMRKARYTQVSCTEALKIGFFGRDLPHWTTSADAVLPWLEKMKGATDLSGCEISISASTPSKISGDPDVIWSVWICPQHLSHRVAHYHGQANSFARAAVIALLRSAGVTVEGTK